MRNWGSAAVQVRYNCHNDMKLYKAGLTVLFAGLIMLSAPLSTYAAEATFFGPIVPDECLCKDQPNPAGGQITTAPDYGCVLQMFQNVVNFTLTMGVILFVLYMVVTGFTFMMSGSNPETRNKAKTRFMNVFVGLVVLLCAWLVIDYVMKTLSSEDKFFGPWNAILASEGGDRCIVAKEPTSITSGLIGIVTGGGGGGTPGAGGGVVQSGTAKHEANKARLAAAGITVSSTGNCSDKTKSTCTSLDGMRENTIDQAIVVKKACNCSVVVTGGTEAGHSGGSTSHAAGFKIDLRITSQLDSYIQSLTRSGSRGSDPRYVDRCGNEYVKEGSPAHWDITVSKGICNPPK